MRTTRRMIAFALAAGAVGNAAALQGSGLVPSADSIWPRWQGRLSLGISTPLPGSALMAGDNPAPALSGASLLGDFYFSRSLHSVGSGHGFRATSGVLLGPRSAPLLGASSVLTGRAFNLDRRNMGSIGLTGNSDVGADTGPVPYVGLGYTGLAGKGGWGFSADFGLMARNPGSIKLGRVFDGEQTLDDALRDMRLSPLVQVGVSYSF